MAIKTFHSAGHFRFTRSADIEPTASARSSKILDASTILVAAYSTFNPSILWTVGNNSATSVKWLARKATLIFTGFVVRARKVTSGGSSDYLFTKIV